MLPRRPTSIVRSAPSQPPRGVRRRRASWCAAALVVLAAALPAQQQRPPSRTELKKLIAEWVTLEGWTEAGRARQAEILAIVARVPPLRDAREVERWSDEIRDAHRKRGRHIATEGEQFWWPEERRGRFFVGGETRRPRGLLIAMHGGGVGSGDAAAAHGHYAPAAQQLGLVCISPEVLEKTECGWTDAGTEEWVMALVDAGLRTFRVDADRVFLAGHSMGGYGAWTLGAHHADRCAGLAPSAGAPTPILEIGSDRVVDLVEGVIPNLRNLRMVVFQSTDDPRVPPGPNQVAFEKIAAARERFGGFDAAEYWEVGDRGHGFPDGGVVRLLEKVVTAERDPLPSRVVWQPDIDWKQQFYWLHHARPPRHAILVADLDRDANRIAITGGAATAGLAVLVDDRLVDMGREVVIEVDGVEVRREIPERRLGTLLLTGQRPDPERMFAARIPVTATGG